MPKTRQQAARSGVALRFDGLKCSTNPYGCFREYEPGIRVRLTTATPRAHSYGDCRMVDGACSVLMDRDRGIEVVTPLFPPHLIVSTPLVVRRTGKGTVTSSPEGISCPPVCRREYEVGDTVTLHAQPKPGFVLLRWEPCAQRGDCSVPVMTPVVRVAAVFVRRP